MGRLLTYFLSYNEGHLRTDNIEGRVCHVSRQKKTIPLSHHSRHQVAQKKAIKPLTLAREPCPPLLNLLVSESTQAIPMHILKRVLEDVPDKVLLEKNYGWNLLHYLAKAGQTQACQLLMKRLGEQPFHEPNSDNKTPLQLLAEFKTPAPERSGKTAPLKPYQSAEKSNKSRTAAGLDLAVAAPAKSTSTAKVHDAQDRLNLDSTVALGSTGFEEKARRLVKK